MNIIKDLEQYMFSSKNMMKYIEVVRPIKVYSITEPIITEPIITVPIITEPIISAPIISAPIITEPIITEPIITEPVPVSAPTVRACIAKKTEESFTPAHKDKLFWCFYVLFNGFSEYEFNKTGYYAVEKAFKIKTVEKLRGMKSEIKALKLKINEVEDELVNKEQITLKGLQVLCLVYKVSITYIYGRKYCEFLYGDEIKGVISQQSRGSHSLLYEDVIDLKHTHWYIENFQKPLNAPTAYTLKELQDICIRLEIPLANAVGTNAVGTGTNAVGKHKTKKELYEDILQKL